MGTAQTAVHTPTTLVSIRNPRDTPISFGASDYYSSEMFYKVVDQFGETLPKQVEVNEKFTSGDISDYKGENRPVPKVTNNPSDPGKIVDTIEVNNPENTLIPITKNPGTPLGTTKIDHWSQEFYIGSLTSGKGVKVQTDTIQRYQDHARHENIMSPP